MAGNTFGKAANQILPALTAPPGAYALVGMAALFAAAAHAPITGIIILFEMTDNYRIILPLMFAVVVAHLMASAIYHDSIYSIKLRRKGALAAPQQEMGVLDILLVTDAMSPEYETVPASLPLEAMTEVARTGRVRSWLVMGEEGELRGIVTETDLEAAIVSGDREGLTVGDIMTTALTTCTPGESLRTAFRRFADRAVYQIPVVDEDDPTKVEGVLRRNELLWAFKELSDEHQRLLQRTGAEITPQDGGSVQMEVQVQEGQADLCFRRVREISLPGDTLIVLLRRGERALVPKGDTKVEPGDVLVLLTTREQEEAVRRWVGAH
jgi:CIC family chloride channel protein